MDHHVTHRGVPSGRYIAMVPSAHPRIQVTVDDELAQALDLIDPAPASRSRLVRDLALRGAAALHNERADHNHALRVLTEIADGDHDVDFAAAAAAVKQRGERLP